MRAKSLFPCILLSMPMLVVDSILPASAGAPLVVSSVTGPASAYVNQTVSVSYRVKNTGDETSGPYEVSLYLSRDRTISAEGDYFWSEIRFENGLPPGKVRNKTTEVTIPNDFLNGLSGNYYYGAIVESSSKASSEKVAVLRWKDNGDGTVTDFKTSLMWQQTAWSPPHVQEGQGVCAPADDK